MWMKKVIGTFMMPLRERVLRVDENTIFETASFSSLLKVIQFQGFLIWRTIIEKPSRQQNGSRRTASSDVPFINLEPPRLSSAVRVMVLTKGKMTGFWTRNNQELMNPLAYLVTTERDSGE
jgi:hypothetical protein